MTEEKLHHFKEKLETEKATLESELETVGKKNPDNRNAGGSTWEVKVDDMNILPADENEVADTMEELDSNRAILNDLEARYTDVTDALAKIDAGTYGVCEISGDQIEEDRLEANPAARTSKAHMNDK